MLQLGAVVDMCRYGLGSTSSATFLTGLSILAVHSELHIWGRIVDRCSARMGTTGLKTGRNRLRASSASCGLGAC